MSLFLCEYCGRKFATRVKLQAHSVLHHDVRFHCVDCANVYVSGGMLARHCRDVHSEHFVSQIICLCVSIL